MFRDNIPDSVQEGSWNLSSKKPDHGTLLSRQRRSSGNDLYITPIELYHDENPGPQLAFGNDEILGPHLAISTEEIEAVPGLSDSNEPQVAPLKFHPTGENGIQLRMGLEGKEVVPKISSSPNLPIEHDSTEAPLVREKRWRNLILVVCFIVIIVALVITLPVVEERQKKDGSQSNLDAPAQAEKRLKIANHVVP